MSLENDIKRIADALEKIVLLQVPGATITGSPSAETVTTTMPGRGPDIPTVTTIQELKSLAQSIASTIPEGSIGHFTDYVRNEICARLGVKKLVEIPLDKIPQVAQSLRDYGKKE